MKNRIAFFLGLGVFALSACSIFPTPRPDSTRFYVLSSSVPANIEQGVVFPAVPFGRISIPSYLDTPQIVTRRGNDISLDEENRWGEPLVRAVARNLPVLCAAKLKGVAIKQPDRIQVSIEQFDGELNGEITLAARYVIFTNPDGALPTTSHFFSISVPVAEPNNYRAYVLAMSSALDLLAAEISESLKK